MVASAYSRALSAESGALRCVAAQPLTSLSNGTEGRARGVATEIELEARREVIIDTSAPVFARRGYHATGIMELCAANDLGKGALYHYIGSKEELLAAIHDRVMDEVMRGADRVAQAGGTPSRQLAMLGDELLDVIHRYPDHVGSSCMSSRPSPASGPRNSVGAAGLRTARGGGSSGGSRFGRVP